MTTPEQGLQIQAGARLEELREQLALGQSELAAKERELMMLKETILRIAGAIQVLDELLGSSEPESPNGRS